MGHSLEDTVARLRAAGEPTRLRILALLRRGDLAVGELVQILGLSQPRLSHQLKVLANAGLVTRLPEGAWVFYRARRDGPAGELIDLVLSQADLTIGAFARDAAQLSAIEASRASAAAAYFDHVAHTWDAIRALHYPEQAIETALLESAGPGPFGQVIDIGTGTGRMLTLFAPLALRAEGLDLSHQMLTVARDNLARARVPNAAVRQGDACATPFEDASADLVIVHQVLHYIDRPAQVLREAGRILKPGGKLLIVDFAPHDLEFLRAEHGHRRLGVAEEALTDWARGTGLAPRLEHRFDPPDATRDGLSVVIWSAHKPGSTPALVEEAAA